MSRKPSIVVRAISSVAAIALTVTGLSVLAIAPAAAANTLVYDSIPVTSPSSYVSKAFQATSTDEFGDYIVLGGTDRVLTDITVGFTTWACQDWATPTPCTTSDSSVSWNHPITLNLYEVDKSGATPAPGALIATVTKDVAVPFRPAASPDCSGTRWKDAVGSCFNGFAFNSTFDFSAANAVLPTDVIVGIAFNTQTYGAAPLGVAGPYNSLNVSLAGTPPTVGSDENADEMVLDTSYPGYTDQFLVDTGYASNAGLVLEINADNELLPTATSTVTVYDKDVKPNEDSTTYTLWHEGKASASPSNASVAPDGLHLGDGAASTVIKGADLTTPTAISKADLRALILAASTTVVSASDPTRLPTFQIPLAFGSALTSGNYTFTTLQTSVEPGANTFVNPADEWRTSRAFGPYPSQQSADTIGGFLDSIYAGGNSVWLYGFGVQADKPSVISDVTWNGTAYEFFQPVVTACTPPLGSVVATNLDSNGWTFNQTRAQGHNQITAGGLHLWTESNTPLDKAAGYRAVNIALADVGTVGIEFADGFTKRPGFQLALDKDGDGGFDGYLVGEPWDYNVPGDGWSPTTNGDWTKAQFWNTNAALGLPDGGGYANLGTLNDYLAYWPTAKITSYGYSLGSGVHGDATITSITVGCTVATVAIATPPAATEIAVNDHQIRFNEATYPGWHEGYNNTARAYSVEADGLHFGDGQHSQILYGFTSPAATSGLEALITGTTANVAAGSVSLQFPVTYGTANNFTTLRSASLPATGVRGVSVTDVWVTTRAILSNTGTEVVPAGGMLTVADFAALLKSFGNVRPLGVGVQADTSARVIFLSASGTKAVFSPYVVPPVTSTVRVPEAIIRLDETTYPGWHEGYTNASKSFSVDENGLTLGTPSHSQIINGFAAPLTTPAVDLLVAGASVDVASGSVTYQVPVYYGPGTDFTTLRSESLGAGSHSFDLQSLWASSRDIPSLSIVAHQLYPLGDLLDKLTNVRVLAFGVQADTTAKITSIVFNQVEYRFDGPIVAGSPTITGTPKVGQTLTAHAGTWAPPGVTFTYRWKADGSAISGATGSTYALTAAEFDKTIVVEVTGHLAGYADKSATSPGTADVAAGPLTPATPTFTGTVAIGSVLAAAPGTWGPAPVAFTYRWSANGTPIPGATNSTYLLPYSAAGKTLTVTVTGTKVGYVTESRTSAPTAQLPANAMPAVQRIAGPDRYTTAVQISQSYSPGVERVYLASGAGFADALSAAPAAAHLNAPLLLTAPKTLPANVRAELIRLSPDEIVVVGGPNTVAESVLDELEALAFGPDVIRIGGADRYETSRSIAAEAFDSAETVYIATGAIFPDALSAAPAAAVFDGPVVLVDGSATAVSAATLQLFDDLNVENVTIAGGPATVKTDIELQLSALYDVKRPYGADRYLTAVALVEDAFDTSSTVYISTGEKFPDALAGAARAGAEGMPVYLSTPGCITPSVFLSILAQNPSKIVILGGVATLSVNVESLQVCQ